MNLDFQQILKRAGWLMGEMQPINSGMVAVPAMKQVTNGQIGLNFIATICEIMSYEHFISWISKNQVKANQAKLSQKMVWISPAGFKAGMEACNS